MAVSAVILSDKDFETTVKVTTTGTNTNALIVDASELEGAASNPRLRLLLVNGLLVIKLISCLMQPQMMLHYHLTEMVHIILVQ